MTVLPNSADVVLSPPLRAVAAAKVDLAPAPRTARHHAPGFVPAPTPPPSPAPLAPGRPRVVLVTEGTYPHAHGGVSVWCDQLVQGLPEVPFSVVALVAFGYQQPIWDVPDHVVSLDTVGLWSPRRARPDLEEHHDPDGPAALLASLLVAAQDDVDGFRRFLDHVAALRVDALGDALAFGPLLAALDRELHRPRGGTLAGVRAADLVEVAEMLDHLLRPLAADPGPAPIYHASSNGLAALVCMAARRRHGGRFLLTEHGIYLRERYLELRRTPMSRAAKALLVRFHRLVSAAAYAEAAVIAPGSEWNQRWESRYGAPARRMRTIYNGIDPAEFPDRDTEPPGAVVSWLGRVDPIKDLDTLIRAFATVAAARPDAELRLYGRTPAGNEAYRAELDALVTELGLDGVVTFPGGVAASADAYTDARVAVLSSISEGFPYSLIEAMACGLPAVATGVGGVPEAVADAGIVVPPRAPELLGEAVVRLLDEPDTRARMGALARERVVGLFTLEHCLAGYRALYDELDLPVERTGPVRLRLAASRKRAGQAGPGDKEDADPSVEPLNTGQQAAVVAAVGGTAAMASAVDAEEVAATLESVGVTDQVAADRFATADVFGLAERAWHRGRIDASRAGGAIAAPAPPPRAHPTTVRDALGRGLAYVLPAVVVAAATGAGAPQSTLVTASLLGWGLAQGGGVLAYTALHRTTRPDDLGTLRRWLVLVVAAVVAVGAGVGVATGAAEGVAFSLPLLHLVASTALVMADRTKLLVAALVPVAALSAAGLALPGSGLVDAVGPTAIATVALALGAVAWLARAGSPAGKAARDLLEPVDRWRAVPLVLAGWVTAAFALLAVAGAGHLPAFREADARHWLIVALPLWGLVAGCEFVLLGLHRSLRALLRATGTVAAYRRAARWTVALWLGGAVAGLQVAAALAALAARSLGLPGYGALTASGIFLVVAVALLAVTVLTTAGRAGAAGAGIGLAALLLGVLAASPHDVGGVGDHIAALAIGTGTAVPLLLSAARSLVDPASHR